MRCLLLTGLFFFFGVNLLYGQSLSQNGLEVENHEEIYVDIIGIDQDAIDVGITENRVWARINIRLRQVDLRPTREYRTEGGLKIHITILEPAFRVDINFNRAVNFFSGEDLYVLLNGTVYKKGMTGTFGQDSSYIISTLDQLLDQFISDYLDAND